MKGMYKALTAYHKLGSEKETGMPSETDGHLWKGERQEAGSGSGSH